MLFKWFHSSCYLSATRHLPLPSSPQRALGQRWWKESPLQKHHQLTTWDKLPCRVAPYARKPKSHMPPAAPCLPLLLAGRRKQAPDTERLGTLCPKIAWLGLTINSDLTVLPTKFPKIILSWVLCDSSCKHFKALTESFFPRPFSAWQCYN